MAHALQTRLPLCSVAAVSGLKKVSSRKQVQTSSLSRRSLAVRAAEEEGEKKTVVFKVVEEVSTSASAVPDFSGFVAKDTAGQQNIYSVEPTVYIADSVLATNSAGTDGSTSGLLVPVAGVSLALAGAAAALIALSSTPVPVTNVTYDGPSLSSFVVKFEAELAPAPAAPALVSELAEEPSVSVEAAIGTPV